MQSHCCAGLLRVVCRILFRVASFARVFCVHHGQCGCFSSSLPPSTAVTNVSGLRQNSAVVLPNGLLLRIEIMLDSQRRFFHIPSIDGRFLALQPPLLCNRARPKKHHGVIILGHMINVKIINSAKGYRWRSPLGIVPWTVSSDRKNGSLYRINMLCLRIGVRVLARSRGHM